LLGLTALMAVSGVVVALAPNFLVLMVGRALIGMVVGGFWSMSAATVMRLVPRDDVPRALAFLNGGNALATTIAAPLGSYLGQFIGWRGAFFAVVPMAALTFIWKYLSLPALPSDRDNAPSSAFGVLGKPFVNVGLAAMALQFMGRFADLHHLRPFLETVTRVEVSRLSLLLLCMGVSGLVGNALIGRVMGRWLRHTLLMLPICSACVALALAQWGTVAWAVALLMALWGLFSTAASVPWWTWLSRTLPRDAEAGGGAMVAVIQLSITLGAALGGMMYDRVGYQPTFVAGASLLVVAGLAGMGSMPKTATHPAY
jgi:predicted MFS family arabinose efflux permease